MVVLHRQLLALLTVQSLSVNMVIALAVRSVTYDENDYLINTPGCKIPNYSLQYRHTQSQPLTVCGRRKIIVNKVQQMHVTFYFLDILEYCRFRFLYGSNRLEPFRTNGGKWRILKNGTRAKLKSDFILVQCGSQYEDVFTNIMKQQKPPTDKPWNVLVLGLDSMSRVRANTMLPRTVTIMRHMNFLDYRAYTISGNDGDIRGVLSSQTSSYITETCSRNDDACSDLWIWNEFESAGYVTARGDDGVGIHVAAEKTSTHHFLKPVYSEGEQRFGNVYCTKTLATGEHVLNYAFDFVETYHSTNGFFGFFWTGRHSAGSPTLLDAPISMLFEKLWQGGFLNNTFLIFFSNHGLRYGPEMASADSYYDARLPMLYIRPPAKFKDYNFDKFLNLFNNQQRLVTPYDLYLTLWDILTNSAKPYEIPTHKRCPKCRSLLRDVPKFRTCARVGLETQWCPCHELHDVTDRTELHTVMDLVMINRVIPAITDDIETLPCTRCAPLALRKLLRVHRYLDPRTNLTHYEVALLLSPGSIGVELTLVTEGEMFRVISRRPITRYEEKRAFCVKNNRDKHFCSCVKIANCNPVRIAFKSLTDYVTKRFL